MQIRKNLTIKKSKKINCFDVFYYGYFVNTLNVDYVKYYYSLTNEDIKAILSE